MSLEGFMKSPNRKNIVSRKEEPLNWERKAVANALAEPQMLDLSSSLPLPDIRKAKEKVGCKGFSQCGLLPHLQGQGHGYPGRDDEGRLWMARSPYF